MKLCEIFLVSFVLRVAGGTVRTSSEDQNRACIIRFLQIRGKLEEDLQSASAPANLCRILLPLIYANQSEKLCLKLFETKSVKANCVFESLKNSEFIDLELKFEIYSKTRNIAKNVKKKKVYDVTRLQRDILMNTSKSCRSDATYGGLFDEILGINSSLIAMQENFCLLKHILDNKFIFVSNINKNQQEIDTSSIDCLAVVTRFQNEGDQKLLEAFRKRRYSADAITCLLNTYHDERIFSWNLAKDFLYKLNISDSVRRAEDWRISKTLSDFNKKSSNCLYSFHWPLF